MKKVLSIILAFICLSLSFFCIGFAQDAEPLVPGSTEDLCYYVSDGVTKLPDNAFAGTEYTSVYLPEAVTYINGRAFENSNIKAVCVTSENVVFETFSADSSLMVILNCSASDAAKEKVAKSGSKWFVYQAFSILGTDILALAYEPELNEYTAPLVDKLILSWDPEYIYYRDTYYNGSVAAEAIMSGNAVPVSPWFLPKILLNITLNTLPEKSVYDENAGGKGLSWLFSLFKKK